VLASARHRQERMRSLRRSRSPARPPHASRPNLGGALGIWPCAYPESHLSLRQDFPARDLYLPKPLTPENDRLLDQQIRQLTT
jgi:hypothetical protein